MALGISRGKFNGSYDASLTAFKKSSRCPQEDKHAVEGRLPVVSLLGPIFVAAITTVLSVVAYLCGVAFRAAHCKLVDDPEQQQEAKRQAMNRSILAMETLQESMKEVHEALESLDCYDRTNEPPPAHISL
mmetsp:Transcript_29993/g.69761  ORF Transcript_29993/g.69761 Transcript_29993/m.69761 type:complete len:131 (+) Transcript_29993:124-516(+)